MKICFRIKDIRTGEFTEDWDSMMTKSGLLPELGFEDIGVQADGTPVIFDKCGNFGYLSSEFKLVVMTDLDD